MSVWDFHYLNNGILEDASSRKLQLKKTIFSHIVTLHTVISGTMIHFDETGRSQVIPFFQKIFFFLKKQV